MADVSDLSLPEDALMLIKLWIDEVNPVEGSVQCGEGGSVAFAGWLELLAVLSEGISAPASDHPPSEKHPESPAPVDRQPT